LGNLAGDGVVTLFELARREPGDRRQLLGEAASLTKHVSIKPSRGVAGSALTPQKRHRRAPPDPLYPMLPVLASNRLAAFVGSALILAAGKRAPRTTGSREYSARHGLYESPGVFDPLSQNTPRRPSYAPAARRPRPPPRPRGHKPTALCAPSVAMRCARGFVAAVSPRT